MDWKFVFNYIRVHKTDPEIEEDLAPKSLKTAAQTALFFCIELMNVNLSWLANMGVSVCKNLQEKVTYEFISASPVVSIMDCKIGGKLLYNCCFVEYCFHNLFKIAPSILV